MAKLALVLGGGGARGFAHLGVLRALKELEFRPQIIVGCSIGALVGAAAAAGHGPELERAALQLTIAKIPGLFSPTISRSGLFSGNGISKFLAKVMPDRKIEDLTVQFAANAVDIRSSQIVTLSSGSLFHAVRASSSLPGLFTPVRDRSRVLIDGGILEPVPVRIARMMGATHVIAVDLFAAENLSPPIGKKSFLRFRRSPTPFSEPAPLNGMIEIMARTLGITQAHLAQEHYKHYPADVLILPKLADTSFADFHRGDIALEAGYKATIEHRESLKKLTTPTC